MLVGENALVQMQKELRKIASFIMQQFFLRTLWKENGNGFCYANVLCFCLCFLYAVMHYYFANAIQEFLDTDGAEAADDSVALYLYRLF
jgi:hypothetical protein